jgi:hypothetical protein
MVVIPHSAFFFLLRLRQRMVAESGLQMHERDCGRELFTRARFLIGLLD